MELRELQLYYLDLLKVFADFCDKEGLKYYLDSGTLLGAVRHKGFIPWDDDVDVSMPIEDFKRFIKIAPQKLGNKYFIQTFNSDKKYNHYFANLRVNGTTSMPVSLKNWDIHWGLEIDIFPIIGAYENILLNKLQKKLFSFNSAILHKDFLVETGKMKEAYLPLHVKLFYFLPRCIRHAFVNATNLFVEKSFYKSENCYKIFVSLKKSISTKIFGEGSKQLFEGFFFNSPVDYDALLKFFYGDYTKLPKEEDRKDHSSNEPIIYDACKNYSEYK